MHRAVFDLQRAAAKIATDKKGPLFFGVHGFPSFFGIFTKAQINFEPTYSGNISKTLQYRRNILTKLRLTLVLFTAKSCCSNINELRNRLV